MVGDFGWEHEGTKSGVDTVKPDFAVDHCPLYKIFRKKRFLTRFWVKKVFTY